MLDNNLFLIIGLFLSILLPFAISRIYMKHITSKISDTDILKSHFNKNRKILSGIGYSFAIFVIITILLMKFTPYIKDNLNLFWDISIYVSTAFVAIGLYFAFNKQYLANKIIKK